MKILLSTGVGYLTHSLPEVEKMALDLGYDGVEVVMPPRHRSPEETMRDTSYQELKHAFSVHAPGDMYDQPRFRSALDDAIGVAEMIGAGKVVMHPARLSLGGRENVTKGVQYIKEKLRTTNVLITYEVLVDPTGLAADRVERFREMQAYETLEAWLADIKEYDLPACLDTSHVGTWFVAPETLLEKLGKNLAHVHFGDYDATSKTEHLIAGTGTMNLAPFLQALANSYPDITLTCELRPPGNVSSVENAARQSIEFINQALGK